MEQVKYYTKDVNQTLKVIYELRDNGYTQGTDFEWCWNPTVWNNDDFSFDEDIPAHCLFTFYNESLASWFILKYL
jgi:hypothetical protein